MSTSELAWTYACFILHDGFPVAAEKISTLVKASNVTVESYWAGLLIKDLERRNVEDLITNVVSGGGAAVTVPSSAPSVAGGAPAAEMKEDKNEEVKEESDGDMGFSVFD